MKRQLKEKKPRNYHAVNAKMRNSAGPLKNKNMKKKAEYARLREMLDDMLDLLDDLEEET